MPLPTLFLVGATHRTAPFGFREKLALGTEGEAALAAELRQLDDVAEFAILNTCNRVEIYGVAESADTLRTVIDRFCTLRHVAAADFERFAFVRRGREVVDHILRVAAGLDSQILGENEIFGQIKRAYAAAQARQSAGAVLNRLFQKTFQAAKHVRTHTGISSGQVSVANVGIDLALTVFSRLADTRILLIGAGEIGEKGARAFLSRGATRVTVASRRFERAADVAHALDGDAISFESVPARLADFDVVVCSTSAPQTVVSVEQVQAARRTRAARPMLFIDLAMPRDVEAGVGALENVFLYNLDDLAAVAARNRQARQAEAEAGRVTLLAKSEALWAALQLQLTTRDAAPREPCPTATPLPAFASPQ